MGGRDLRRERTRKEILRAAEHIFASKGYHGARLEDIAEEAHYTPGALYTYFSSKEELYWALMDDIAENFFDYIRENLPMDGDFEEMLGAFVLRLFEFATVHQDAIALHFRQEVFPSVERQSEHSARIKTHFMELFECIEGAFMAEARKKTVFKKHLESLVTPMLVGVMTFVFNLRIEGFIDKSPSEMRDLVVEVFLDGHRKK